MRSYGRNRHVASADSRNSLASCWTNDRSVELPLERANVGAPALRAREPGTSLVVLQSQDIAAAVDGRTAIPQRMRGREASIARQWLEERV